MKIFISGGCKNGKSYYAQRLAKKAKKTNLYYIATMKAVDYEDSERIIRHRQDRKGWGFITIEQPYNIEEILNKTDHDGSFLLDSLTALLANEMFPFNPNAYERTAAGLIKVLDKLNNLVIVSDYIYSDAIQYDPDTESYRKSLAALDSLVAQHCDVVLEVVYTQIIFHKGKDVAGFEVY